jgi:O-antigen ligase
VALQHYQPDEQARVLKDIADAGFRWVRQRFPWDAIEPTPGHFAWDTWDPIVTSAATHGLDLVAVLDGSPEWARAPADANNVLAPPTRAADFGRFAQVFANRYADQVHIYQVWDEPNITPHWGTRAANPADYTGLLREGAIQIRTADPEATVLAAALAPNVEAGGANLSDTAFLEGLYQAGAMIWFDGTAAQPYGFDRPPGDPPNEAVLNFRRAELLREVMLRHDDGATPLWLVAHGWHAPQPGSSSQKSPWQSVTEEIQAQWAVEAADWASHHWPWVGGLAWAWWQPPQPANDPHWGFALTDVAGQARPVLKAIQDWNIQTSALTAGIWPPDQDWVHQQGGWRLTGEAADPPHGAAAGNNQLTIPFEGTGLALDIQRGPYWAYLTVTVDGEPANQLPVDGDGKANLVLHDPLANPDTVIVASHLARGYHEAEVVATGGWDQWPVRSIVVTPPQPATDLRWLAGLLVLAGSCLAVWGGIGIFRQTKPGPEIAPLAQLDRHLQNLNALLQMAGYGLAFALALALFLGPSWLATLSGLLLMLLFFVVPQSSLPLLAAVTPLFLVPVSMLGRSWAPPEVISWMAALALFLRWLIHRLGASDRQVQIRRFHLTGLDWSVLALLAAATLATASAQATGVAVHELRRVFVNGVLVYWLVRLMPATDPSQRWNPWPLVWGIGLGAGLISAWSLYQAVTGVGLIGAEGVWRVRGPFGSPNNLALYLGHTLPIFLSLAALGIHRRRRALATGLIIPIALALLLTFSKGALLLGLPAAVLFLGFAAGGRWRWVAMAAVLLGGLALLPLFQTERFASLFDLESGTSFLRLQLWRGAWNMILDFPWLGVGPDNFLYAYRTTYVVPAAWQELNLSHPHNILLDFWTRLGLVGVIAGVWLFVAAFRQGWRGANQATEDRHALVLGLLASLLSTLSHGLIDNSVFLVDLMLLFSLTLGLIARLPSNGSLSPGQSD